jgi:hypothetical protein
VLKEVVHIVTAGFKRLFQLSEEDHEGPQSGQPGFLIDNRICERMNIKEEYKLLDRKHVIVTEVAYRFSQNTTQILCSNNVNFSSNSCTGD